MNYSNLERSTGENVNINGHMRSKEALLRGVANLRDFVENAPEGLRMVGPDGLILWANRTELFMLGYTREEYIGHHIAEFHADEEKMVSAYEQESAARAVAEAANRSKDEFIAVVLHALRSPLNVILGYDLMLREDQPDTAQLKKSCDVIVRNARAQLELIDELLTSSRTGKLAAVRRLMSGSRAAEAYEVSGQAARQ
jgi:signal transduction histidine kinase